jgi:hypothetical protein
MALKVQLQETAPLDTSVTSVLLCPKIRARFALRVTTAPLEPHCLSAAMKVGITQTRERKVTRTVGHARQAITALKMILYQDPVLLVTTVAQ